MRSPVIKDSCKPHLLKVMSDGIPRSTGELAKLVNRGEDAVRVILKDMKGKAYICDWGGLYKNTALWTLGNKPHVPRPKYTPSRSSQVTMAGRRRKNASEADYLTRPYVTSERIWGI